MNNLFVYNQRIKNKFKANKMNAWGLLGLAIGVEICATNLLKISNGFSKFLPTIFSLGLYSISFYLLAVIFKTLPVGLVYAIWSGIGIVFTSIIAYFLFDQKINSAGIVGIILIIIGVVIINLFSTQPN